MNILVITQKVDQDDTVLGFFHGWLNALGEKFDHVSVICLEKGSTDLPQDMPVYSLGKESGFSRIRYVWNLFFYLGKLHHRYDCVLVHMNYEYVLLAGWWWRLFGRKIGFWYNHTYGNIFSRIAFMIAHRVFHTSPFAFSAGRSNSVSMPAGIDTKLFSTTQNQVPNTILFVGRIAPVKGLITLIKAVQLLVQRGVSVSLNIYGEALSRDRKYQERVHVEAQNLVTRGIVKFHNGVAYDQVPQLFASHEFFVNLTPKGNFDKTVLEAMASGAIPVVSSTAFSDLLPPPTFFKEHDADDLARQLEYLMKLSFEEKSKIRGLLRKRVEKKHDLHVLVSRLAEEFDTL